MDNALYDYSPIVDRPKLSWPDGARVAFYIGLNVEHFEIGKPSTSLNDGTANLVPDALNHGWRDYGSRVGFWRLLQIFDKHNIRPSVLLNSDVAKHYPQIIEAGKGRNWAWLAHGKNNSRLHSGIAPNEEPQILDEIIDTIERASGQRPKGWMGPALTETFQTPKLLSQRGLSYVLDWTADDQPFELNVPGMFSVPYSVELNDLAIFPRGLSGKDFLDLVVDQFDQLYEDGAETGRVMPLALHPFVIGQAFRAKYLDKALAYIAGHDGVWLTTSDEIVQHYQEQVAGVGSTATTGVAA